MNVLILTEGGKNIGFGHLTRMIAIYQEFAAKGYQTDILVNGDNSVNSILKNYNFKLLDWTSSKINLKNIVRNYDITIIDSYLAKEKIYELISVFAKIPVYYDDLNRIPYPKGIVINGNIYAKSLNYPKKEDILYLLGTKYFPLRKEFWNTPKKKIQQNITQIMVTFGGNDIRNLTPKILKILNEEYPKVQKQIIIGKGFQNINEIKNVSDKNTELIIFPDTGKMKSVMQKSDIAISAGGQTLYELACTGTPTVAIMVANNQVLNINEFEKRGLIKYAGNWNDNKLRMNLINCLHSLENYQTRRDISVKMQKIIDSEGVKRISNILTTNHTNDGVTCYE